MYDFNNKEINKINIWRLWREILLECDWPRWANNHAMRSQKWMLSCYPRHVLTQIASQVAACPSIGRLTIRCHCTGGKTVTLCAVRRVRWSRPPYWSDARPICGWWVLPHSQSRLNSIDLLKSPAICSLLLCWASHSALPQLAADYCERLTE